MAWRDNLRPASFRGVPFETFSTEDSGARRALVAELPGLDDPIVQDLGREAGEIRFDAFLIGDDHDDQRRALVTACQQAGPGELVHPYLGTIPRALCTGCVVRTSSSDGGMTRLALEFVRAPARGRAGSSGTDATDAAADRAGDAAEQAAGEALDLEGEPSHVAEAAGEEVERMGGILGALRLGGSLEAVASWARRVAELVDEPLAVLAGPYEYAQAVRLLLGDLATAAGSRRMALELYLGILDVPRPRGTAGGNLGPRAEAAAVAVWNLHRTVALGEAVRTAAAVEWEHRQEAEAARERLSTRLDDLEESAADDLFGPLAALRAALWRSVPSSTQRLPELVRVALPEPTSSLLVAYDLYGDADREPDVVRRNPGRIRHPGQIASGSTLEVLHA